MSFVRVKPAGYVDGDGLPAAELNPLDIDHANAIDGADGGSYDPSADIEFPGVCGPSWGPTRWPKCSSRTVYRSQSLAKLGDTTSVWAYSYSGKGWVSPDAAASSIYIPIDNLVAGATLAATRVWLIGGAGHGGVPGMPVVSVYRLEVSGALTLLGSAADPSADVPTYEAVHYVDVTGMAEVITQANGERYFIQVQNESGAWAAAGLTVRNARCAFTCSEIHPGG
ncbi:MAG: hypothetical protein ACYC6C_13585 [Coriobacteriia bacterium]